MRDRQANRKRGRRAPGRRGRRLRRIDEYGVAAFMVLFRARNNRETNATPDHRIDSVEQAPRKSAKTGLQRHVAPNQSLQSSQSNL